MAISEREHKFCLNYVKNGGVITDAGVKAGYSRVYMDRNGYKLMKKPYIQEEITRLRARVEQRTDKSAIDVVNQISKHAFAEILDYSKPDPEHPGNYIGKDPDELTPDQRAAVASFRVVTEYVKDANGNKVKPEQVKRYLYKYELHAQPLALIQMGRHYGVFDDKLRITNGAGNRFANLTPDKLAELRAQIIKYMSDSTGEQSAIEGEFSESPQKMLPDDRGSAEHGRSSVGGKLRSGGGRGAAS